MQNIPELDLLNEFARLMYLQNNQLIRLLRGFDVNILESALFPLPVNYQNIFTSCLSDNMQSKLADYKIFLKSQKNILISNQQYINQLGRVSRCKILSKYFSINKKRLLINIFRKHSPIEIDLRSQFTLLTQLTHDELSTLLKDFESVLVSTALSTLSPKIQLEFLDCIFVSNRREIVHRMNRCDVDPFTVSSCQIVIIHSYYIKVLEAAFQERIVQNVCGIPSDYDNVRHELIKEIQSRGGIVKFLKWW